MIHITKFSGIAPRVSPRALANEQAVTAQNVDLSSGTLKPFNTPRTVDQPTKAGTINTIYLFGAASGVDQTEITITGLTVDDGTHITLDVDNSPTRLSAGDRVYVDLVTGTTDINGFVYTLSAADATSITVVTPANGGWGAFTDDDAGRVIPQNGHWFHWTATEAPSGVDVAVPVVPDATDDFIAYTGITSVPAFTFTTLAVTDGSGTDYPRDYYRLGIPAPTATPKALFKGTAAAGTTSYAWVYTLVGSYNGVEFEGPPSSPITETDEADNSEILLYDMDTSAPAGWSKTNLTKIRIYRLLPGTYGTEGLYYYVAESDIDLCSTGPMTSWSNADPTVIGSVGHGLLDDEEVFISGTSEPILDDKVFTVTYITDDTFSVDVSSAPAAAGPAGTWERGYLDTIGALGLPILTTDYSTPPTDLTSITVMPNGSLAGISGKTVRLSIPEKMWAWPDDYEYSFPHTPVALKLFGTTLLVMTDSVPYTLTGSDPASMERIELTSEKSITAHRSAVSLGTYGVGFASPAGFSVWRGGATIANYLRELLDRANWKALSPEDMHCYFWDDRAFFFNDTGGYMVGFDGSDAHLTTSDLIPEHGNYSPISDDLFLLDGGYIKRFDAGAAQDYTWKSKEYIAPKPVVMRFCQVIADTYNATLAVKVYANDVLRHTEAAVTSDKPFPITNGDMARVWQVQVDGQDELYEVHLAQTQAELGVV